MKFHPKLSEVPEEDLISETGMQANQLKPVLGN